MEIIGSNMNSLIEENEFYSKNIQIEVIREQINKSLTEDLTQKESEILRDLPEVKLQTKNDEKVVLKKLENSGSFALVFFILCLVLVAGLFYRLFYKKVSKKEKKKTK